MPYLTSKKEFLKSIRVKPEKEKTVEIHQLKYIKNIFTLTDLLLFVLSMYSQVLYSCMVTITISQAVSENSFVTLHTLLFCQNFHKNCHSNKCMRVCVYFRNTRI